MEMTRQSAARLTWTKSLSALESDLCESMLSETLAAFQGICAVVASRTSGKSSKILKKFPLRMKNYPKLETLTPGWHRERLPTWGANVAQSGVTSLWFPVVLSDGASVVITLCVDRDAGVESSTIIEAWFNSQKLVSQNLIDEPHERFTNCLEGLRELSVARERSLLLHGISHCIVSPHSLGWSRFWLFAESQARGGFFDLLSSHGLLRLEKWRRSHRSLVDEVQSALACSSANPLSERCGAEPWIVPIDPDTSHAWFPHAARRERTPVFVPELSTAPTSRMFRAELKERCRGDRDFQEDSTVFFVPLWVGQRRHFAVVSPCEGTPLPSLVQTSVLLHRLTQILADWDTTNAAPAKEDGDGLLLTGSTCSGYSKCVPIAEIGEGSAFSEEHKEGPPVDTDVRVLLDQSIDSFRRESDQLLKTHHDEWVAYFGPNLVAIAENKAAVLKMCYDRGLKDNSLFVAQVLEEMPSAYASWEEDF